VPVGRTCRLYAWALIPNHFHLLVRPEVSSLSSFTRRLMTSHAVRFPLRHARKRTGVSPEKVVGRSQARQPTAARRLF